MSHPGVAAVPAGREQGRCRRCRDSADVACDVSVLGGVKDINIADGQSAVSSISSPVSTVSSV